MPRLLASLVTTSLALLGAVAHAEPADVSGAATTGPLAGVAVGARMALHPRVGAYVQIGAGVELTSVSVPYGDNGEIAAMKALPDAYLGVGGEIRVFGRAHAGASLRVHAMGNFDYDPAKLEMQPGWTAPPAASAPPAAVVSRTSTGNTGAHRARGVTAPGGGHLAFRSGRITGLPATGRTGAPSSSPEQARRPTAAPPVAQRRVRQRHHRVGPHQPLVIGRIERQPVHVGVRAAGDELIGPAQRIG